MRELVNILDGNTFLVSDRRGDVDPAPDFPTGLFCYDTRFLSTWQLTINGERLHVLSVDDIQYFESRFFLVPGAPTHYVDAKVSVIRHRTIGGSFDEDLTVINSAERELELTVRIEMGSDFADIFEIKDPKQKKGHVSAQPGNNQLCLSYRRGSFHRKTVITTSAPAAVDENGMTFQVRIPSHGEWQTHLHVSTQVLNAADRDFRESLQIRYARPAPELLQDLEQWMSRTPTLGCEIPQIASAYRRSLTDLIALRYTSITLGIPLIAAGLPWFMTIFGRDSILTALQALPFLPQLARPTLCTLAYSQGTRIDDFRDEEPGKILHELRYGESAAFEEQPHSPYYGTADATPLFLILLDEYERWSGDGELVRELEYQARAALNWIDRYADLLGTGYIWYRTRNHRNGL